MEMKIEEIVEEIKGTVANAATVTAKEIATVAREKYKLSWTVIDRDIKRDEYKVKRGVYNLTNYQPQGAAVKVNPGIISKPTEAPQEVKLAASVGSVRNSDVHIPEKDSSFIPWGHFKSVEKIIASRMFFPTYISGMSGNGKTMMVEQACAKLKRDYIRVQISPATDEEDLIGGWALVDGETVFNEGPVIKAMRQGSILLLDEMDRGTNKAAMAIQSVAEGKPILIKKTGEVVAPEVGFNIIATANTKGNGSDDGRYSAASIIDDAFLERFTVTFEQPYPSAAVEERIIFKHAAMFGVEDEDYLKKLVSWSAVIRKTFEEEGCEELISTRRLCGIVKTYSIFQDRMSSIEMCIARFNEEVKDAFLELYKMVDGGQVEQEVTKEEEPLF